MNKPQDRMVFQRKNGDWVNKRSDANKASSLHSTQAGAEATARAMLRNQGGGELTTKGRDQRIRSKDTIAPGNDPRSIKDTEH